MNEDQFIVCFYTHLVEILENKKFLVKARQNFLRNNNRNYDEQFKFKLSIEAATAQAWVETIEEYAPHTQKLDFDIKELQIKKEKIFNDLKRLLREATSMEDCKDILNKEVSGMANSGSLIRYGLFAFSAGLAVAGVITVVAFTK